MPDFEFYTEVYGGRNLTAETFEDYAVRAADELAYFERIYHVSEYPDIEEGRKLAVCGMASVLRWFDTRCEEARSVSIGSVSCGGAAAPTEAEKSHSLLKCCERYLYVYRGAGSGFSAGEEDA